MEQNIKKLLDGKKVIRGKISFSIVLGQVIEQLNFCPKEIFNEATLESIFYKLSKIETLLSQITLDKNYKRERYKKAINSLNLDESKSEENAMVITEFLDDMDNSTKELKEKVIRELIDIKEKFQLFTQTDLLKPEKTKVVKDIIGVYSSFVEEQLKKGRQVDTPLGKYYIKTNKRFGTKSVGFDVNTELKKYLLDTSDKNIEEIEKQRESISKNILEHDKHLERLNPKKRDN